MRRFVVPVDAIAADRVVLRGGEAHHAAVVLRLQPGARIVVVGNKKVGDVRRILGDRYYEFSSYK